MQQEIIDKIERLKSMNKFLEKRINSFKKMIIQNNVKIRSYIRQDSSSGLTINEYALFKYLSYNKISINGNLPISDEITLVKDDLLTKINEYFNGKYSISDTGKGIIRYDNFIFTVNNFNIINCKKDDNK